VYFILFFNVSSYAAPQIPLCHRMLGWNPGLFRPWNWLSGFFIIRLDLFHKLAVDGSLVYFWGHSDLEMRGLESRSNESIKVDISK
jgi:hypothetical protein